MNLKMTFTRRTILKTGLISAGLIIVKGLIRFLGFQEPPTTVILKKVLDSPNAYRPGSITPVPEVRGVLMRDESGLYALSAVCTHLGCLVQFNGTQFQCPCHGSQYQQDGTVIAGPATQPLPHVALSLSNDNRLIIDAATTVPAEQRIIPVGA